MRDLRPSLPVWAGIAATVGVAVVGVGEYLLHYNPLGYADSANFQFLQGLPRKRLIAGHFLAVLAAPAYLLGYWALTQGFARVSQRNRALFTAIAFYTFVVAAIWIGSRGFLAVVVQANVTGVIADYKLLLESLIWIVRVGVAVYSVLLVAFIVKSQTIYPRWFAWINPIVLLLAVFSTLAWPALGSHLVPSAMNVAHLPFFAVMTLLLANADRTTSS